MTNWGMVLIGLFFILFGAPFIPELAGIPIEIVGGLLLLDGLTGGKNTQKALKA